MARNTRLQTAANVKFQANLTSAIHRLPNEVMAHIFVTGCPSPNHKLKQIDVAPLQHQVLVGSICKLWREIAHECPDLWTSVAVRYPILGNKASRKKLKFCEDMVRSVLRRSGRLEVDLSIRSEFFLIPASWRSAHSYYDLVAPHLQRVQTLDVFVKHRDDFLDWFRDSDIPKLRHFYTKGRHHRYGGLYIPPCAIYTPLETFYCELPAFHIETIPTSWLRYIHISKTHVTQKIVDFVSRCSNLQVLEVRGLVWEPDVIISSSTLNRLDLDTVRLVRLPARVWDGLPNLLHLRLRADGVDIWKRMDMSWAPLPSLRSLSVDSGGGEFSFACLTDILHCAPQLVALQLAEVDTLEAIKFFGAHRGDELGGGIGRKPLRLVYLTTTREQVQGRWGELLTIAPILCARYPFVGTAWHLEKCVNPIVIDGVKIGLCAYGVELSPPLSVRADEIADEDVRDLSRVAKLDANG
jgi:hypothetical protein